MRANRTYSIELEFIERIAEEKINASGLINELLGQYFKKPLTEQEKEINQKLENAQKEKERIEKEMKTLRESKEKEQIIRTKSAQEIKERQEREQQILINRIKEIVKQLPSKPKNEDEFIELSLKYIPEFEREMNIKYQHTFRKLMNSCEL